MQTLDVYSAEPQEVTANTLGAGLATAATARLAARALEEVLDTTVYTPELGLLLDQFDTCAMAVAGVTRAILACGAPDAPTCELVLTGLARMNNRCWQQTSGDRFVRHFLLLDTAQRLLVDLVRQIRKAPPGKGRPTWRKSRLSTAAAAHVRSVIDAVLALACDGSLLATHLLVGVTLRSLADICLGSAERHPSTG